MEKNDIVQDAYYLIHKFNDNGIEVTNLHIQKLMYFFEAYYMLIHEEETQLYDCAFNAWGFGPVAIPLYKKFRKYGSKKIELTKQEINLGNGISKEKKKLLNDIYEVFKGKSAMDLVDYTHMKDSPWSKVWAKNGSKVGYGANTHIDKISTKEWFREVFTH